VRWPRRRSSAMLVTMTQITPSPQAIAAQTRSKPQQVSGKLKLVLDMVVNEGADPYEAGRTVGMHARSIRLSLAKPHVLAYLRRARQVLRETARAQNIHHQIRMRAESPNEMARLGAMKLLEQDDDRSDARAHVPVMPGLLIVINAPPSGSPKAPPVVSDHEKRSNDELDDDAQEPRVLMAIKR
jgi:hypothetical protein